MTYTFNMKPTFTVEKDLANTLGSFAEQASNLANHIKSVLYKPDFNSRILARNYYVCPVCSQVAPLFSGSGTCIKCKSQTNNGSQSNIDATFVSFMKNLKDNIVKVMNSDYDNLVVLPINIQQPTVVSNLVEEVVATPTPVGLLATAA